jgi:hypothetical protein
VPLGQIFKTTLPTGDGTNPMKFAKSNAQYITQFFRSKYKFRNKLLTTGEDKIFNNQKFTRTEDKLHAVSSHLNINSPPNSALDSISIKIPGGDNDDDVDHARSGQKALLLDALFSKPNGRLLLEPNSSCFYRGSIGSSEGSFSGS